MTAVVNPCIGMVTPYDFALDRELWRWVPDTLDLMITRTPYEPLTVSVEMARRIGDPAVVAEATLALATPAPAVCSYLWLSIRLFARALGRLRPGRRYPRKHAQGGAQRSGVAYR